MLWISIFLPDLCLQAHCRDGLGHLVDIPLAVSDGTASRPCVHAANPKALQAGIKIQMPLAAAQARATGLIVIPRNIEKEKKTVALIAEWLSQFTPMVCIESEGASLDVSASLRLFGGIAAITERIRIGIGELGFNVDIGVAPTPLAAWLLAKASRHRGKMLMCPDPAHLPEYLGEIPLVFFPWPAEVLQVLDSLGFACVNDLLQQPRTGLNRRLGNIVVHDLDRALARIPDPRVPIRLAENFRADIDLPFEVIDTERLAVPVGMLLAQMQGFLRARDAAVSKIELELKHGRVLVTRHGFGARQPIRHAADWMCLIRERLSAHPFAEPVSAIGLSTGRLSHFQKQNVSWLPTAHGHHEEWQTLLARIASRLDGEAHKGESSVFSIRLMEDPRPERAWCADGGHEKSPHSRQSKSRPLLLLSPPLAISTTGGVPEHHGLLEFLTVAERVEAGWWDNRPVVREYFIARNPQQEICWVFRDFCQDERWYLHGYFS
ncbi:MAG: DNA polymerase Y family protein [Betaproteobacteria bacterium]|nr:DNA polymerase Y family protein [Betaproteobacteria bacterium]